MKNKLISQKLMGNKNGYGNRGKKRTPEVIEKMRLLSTGNKNMLGKRHTPETKLKISIARKGKVKGVEHPAWKGGITPIHNKIRGSSDYKYWERTCLCRDIACKKCGEIRVKYLMVHHILNFSSHVEKRFDLKNGIVLCRPCHKEFHKKYGKRNNTRKQLQEFLRTDK